MIHSLSIGRIYSIILRSHSHFSQRYPINLGSFSTKSHIIKPKRSMYARISIFAHSYFNFSLSFIFNSLSNYIVCKKLKEYLLLLNSHYNDDSKSVKRKMLSTSVDSLRRHIIQRLMSEKKLLSTLFLRVIHKGIVGVSRAHIHDLRQNHKSYPQFKM